MTLLSLNY